MAQPVVPAVLLFQPLGTYGISYDIGTHALEDPVPDGWYYLADAGFPCSEVLLVPYPGVHYHLREWGAANLLYA